MPTAHVNGVRLHYELGGRGDIAIVLVHGSWASHHDWDLLVPGLGDTFRTLAYDRRGHSQSERAAGTSTVHDDVDDLAALIEERDLAPAWVLGSSFGTSIALRLAIARPDILRGVIGHEPPLFSVIAGDPEVARPLHQTSRTIGELVERIASGDHVGAAKQFIDEVALGPGSWDRLPPEVQRTHTENAPTFLEEAKDPDQLEIDVEALRKVQKPVRLTHGGESPPLFAAVAKTLAEVLPRGETTAFPGAGHIPHVTHPEAYAESVTAFARGHE